SAVYDTRDSKKHPTNGVYISGQQDLAGAGGDVNYLRNTGEIRGYYSLTPDITLAARGLGGTISGWGGPDLAILAAFLQRRQNHRRLRYGWLGPARRATGQCAGGPAISPHHRRASLWAALPAAGPRPRGRRLHRRWQPVRYQRAKLRQCLRQTTRH